MPTNETYSNILRRTAQPWGVTLSDRMLDDEDIPRPTVVERMEWHGAQPGIHCRIEIVTLNGLWSYTTNFLVKDFGGGFGAYLKFCKPVNTREQALAAAVAHLKEQRAIADRELAVWLEQLQPLQMSLL